MRGSQLGLHDTEFEPERGKHRILQCTCRCVGCADFVCRITVDETSVTWSEFQMTTASVAGIDPGDYSRLGPFRFERRAYEDAVYSLRPYLLDPPAPAS